VASSPGANSSNRVRTGGIAPGSDKREQAGLGGRCRKQEVCGGTGGSDEEGAAAPARRAGSWVARRRSQRRLTAEGGTAEAIGRLTVTSSGKWCGRKTGAGNQGCCRRTRARWIRHGARRFPIRLAGGAVVVKDDLSLI